MMMAGMMKMNNNNNSTGLLKCTLGVSIEETGKIVRERERESVRRGNWTKRQ